MKLLLCWKMSTVYRLATSESLLDPEGSGSRSAGKIDLAQIRHSLSVLLQREVEVLGFECLGVEG